MYDAMPIERLTAEMIDAGEAWAAVLARDRAYDGRFVTGVLTTGIYCRPSCAARHPRRHLPLLGRQLDRARQLVGALPSRPRSKPIHRTLPATFGDHQKSIEPLLLVTRDPRRQQSPEPAVGAGPDPRNGTLEDARAW